MARRGWPAILVAVVAARAAADPKPDYDAVRRQFDHAAERYAAGAYRAALADLEAVYAATQATALLPDQAACHEALGERDRATELYRRYLEGQPHEATVEERLAALRAGKPLAPPVALGGAVLVHTLPAAMTISVDGRQVGS